MARNEVSDLVATIKQQDKLIDKLKKEIDRLTKPTKKVKVEVSKTKLSCEVCSSSKLELVDLKAVKMLVCRNCNNRIIKK